MRLLLFLRFIDRIIYEWIVRVSCEIVRIALVDHAIGVVGGFAETRRSKLCDSKMIKMAVVMVAVVRCFGILGRVEVSI